MMSMLQGFFKGHLKQWWACYRAQVSSKLIDAHASDLHVKHGHLYLRASLKQIQRYIQIKLKMQLLRVTV